MTLHYRAEGRHSYAVLLFVPSTRPFDLFDPGRKGRVKLYVRRVYITDDADLLAVLSALRARRGRQRGPAAQHLARDAAEQPAGRADPQGLDRAAWSASWKASADKDAEAYGKIWEAFGPVLKEGLYEDHERREQLLGAGALRHDGRRQPRSLKQYVADLKPNQTEIYYLVGDSAERLKSNPKLEAARARGVEVLLLTDPVDAFWTVDAARLRGQAAEVAEPGRCRFRLDPAARRQEGRGARRERADEARSCRR